jgi:hypothetical protein
MQAEVSRTPRSRALRRDRGIILCKSDSSRFERHSRRSGGRFLYTRGPLAAGQECAFGARNAHLKLQAVLFLSFGRDQWRADRVLSTATVGFGILALGSILNTACNYQIQQTQYLEHAMIARSRSGWWLLSPLELTVRAHKSPRGTTDPIVSLNAVMSLTRSPKQGPQLWFPQHPPSRRIVSCKALRDERGTLSEVIHHHG